MSWASANQAKQIIPETQLYPAGAVYAPVLSADVANGTNLLINWAGTCTLLSASEATGPWSPVDTATLHGPYTTNLVSQPRMFFRLQSQ